MLGQRDPGVTGILPPLHSSVMNFKQSHSQTVTLPNSHTPKQSHSQTVTLPNNNTPKRSHSQAVTTSKQVDTHRNTTTNNERDETRRDPVCLKHSHFCFMQKHESRREEVSGHTQDDCCLWFPHCACGSALRSRFRIALAVPHCALRFRIAHCGSALRLGFRIALPQPNMELLAKPPLVSLRSHLLSPCAAASCLLAACSPFPRVSLRGRDRPRPSLPFRRDRHPPKKTLPCPKSAVRKRRCPQEAQSPLRVANRATKESKK